MFVTVIAMNEGHSGAHRAGRYFPNGQDVVLEVLDQTGDPPLVKGPKGTPVPDPQRIGTDSLTAIRNDPRLKLLADASTQTALSKAAYDEAVNSAKKSAGEAAGHKIEVARLQDENGQLRDKVADLERKLADAMAAQQPKGESPGAKLADAGGPGLGTELAEKSDAPPGGGKKQK